MGIRQQTISFGHVVGLLVGLEELTSFLLGLDTPPLKRRECLLLSSPLEVSDESTVSAN